MRERGDRGAGRRGDAATRGDPVGTGRRGRGRAARRATRRATFATFEDDAFGSTFGSSAPSAARDRGRASEIWRGARGRDLGEGTVRRATHLAEDLRDEARLALGRDGFLEQRDVREELSRGPRGGGGGEGEGGEGTATVRHRRGGRRRRVKWTWARLGSGTPGVGTHHVEDVEGLRRLLLLRLGLLIVLVFHLHVGTHRGARGRARRKRAEVWRGAIAREEKKRTNPPRLRRRRNFEPPRPSTAMTRPFLVYACRTRRVRSGR